LATLRRGGRFWKIPFLNSKANDLQTGANSRFIAMLSCCSVWVSPEWPGKSLKYHSGQLWHVYSKQSKPLIPSTKLSSRIAFSGLNVGCIESSRRLRLWNSLHTEKPFHIYSIIYSPPISSTHARRLIQL
jgi:hypothetical protein